MGVAISGHESGVAELLELSDGSMRWQPLPPWLSSFFALGERVAMARAQDVRTCSVVIPPVRAFSAAFAATGAVVGVATAEPEIDVEAHFAELASLDGGTPLVVKMGDKIYAAKFVEICDESGTECVKIEYDGMTQYLPKALCHRAHLGTGGKRSLPKAPGRTARENSRAIEAILGSAADEFLATPTVDVVLVGSISLLGHELTTMRVRSRKARPLSIDLASVLRPSRLMTDGGISRSLLASDRASEFELPVADIPRVAVFDGSRAFARYRKSFEDSSWIAILDRCSPSYSEGVDIANQEFSVRRGAARFLDELSLPPGTEAQFFERAR